MVKEQLCRGEAEHELCRKIINLHIFVGKLLDLGRIRIRIWIRVIKIFESDPNCFNSDPHNMLQLAGPFLGFSARQESASPSIAEKTNIFKATVTRDIMG